MKSTFKPPTIHEIKDELTLLDKKELVDICLRLGKAKVENKELLGYLLFQSQNERVFIDSVKEEMQIQIKEMNNLNFYLAKKTIRKVLRTVNKFIRFSGNKKTELELRIYFCLLVKETRIQIKKHPVLLNLYNNQLKKIASVLKTVHEDERFDYSPQLQEIELL